MKIAVRYCVMIGGEKGWQCVMAGYLGYGMADSGVVMTYKDKADYIMSSSL